ncbi:MAG TPA: lysylphosphatidylglycerol synthase transmembrane domain-containing protein [Pirellulales bacterium]|nr:lysylphosphatidylglycerol synthase transmembrane domain-containing protein [Pirellulales bacterium]
MSAKRPILTALWVIVACGLPALLLWWCFRDVDLDRLTESIGRVRWGLLAAGAAIVSAVQLMVACEWALLLPREKRIGFRRLLEAVNVMVMLQNSVHHFAGHAFAIYHLGHRQRVGKSVMLSVLSMDQLAEATARLLTWAFLALFIGLPAWAVGGVGTVFGLACVLYTVLIVCAWRHRDFQVVRNPARLRGWARLRYHFSEWAHYLHGIRRAEIMLGAVALAIGKKLARSVGVYCVQQSFGLDLPLYAPLLVVASLDLATMISVTPGHLGIFEAALFFIYQYLGLPPTEAMILALFDHLVFILGAVLPGCVVSARWGFRLRRDAPSPAASNSEPSRLSTNRQDSPAEPTSARRIAAKQQAARHS